MIIFIMVECGFPFSLYPIKGRIGLTSVTFNPPAMLTSQATSAITFPPDSLL